MITTLLKARDANFKVEIIKVLSGLGEEFRTPVVLAASQVWQGGDPAARQAIVDAIMVMGPAAVEPNPDAPRAENTGHTRPTLPDSIPRSTVPRRRTQGR